jgi:N-acetylglucosaminyldiphosphoundecaprenol N-acetyl-beta-D-mannosaminyltransferase
MTQLKLLGVRIDDIPLDELLRIMAELSRRKTSSIISNVNVHAMNIASKQKWFRDYLNDSRIVFCDGFGIWIGAFLQGKRIRNRYTPPDWIDKFIKSNDYAFRFFFLGSKEGVAERAAQSLLLRSPHFKVSGCQHGYFNMNRGSIENESVISKINASGADVLLVGFGMPLQEKWILDNHDRLSTKLILPVGALFDFLAGEIQRPPKWMTEHGLEWLGRLIIEPRRLWRRYLIGNPLFIWHVLLERLKLVHYN